MVKNVKKAAPKKQKAPIILNSNKKITDLLKEYRVMYLKLKNGEELVTWVAPFGTGAKLMKLDIESADSSKKTELEKEEILLNLEQEIKDRTELFMTQGNHSVNNLVEIKYPTKLTYSTNYNENLSRQTPVVFLTPWISTSISSSQLFPLAKNDIVSLTSVEPELLALYVKTVQRIVLSITVSKQLEKTGVEEPGFDWDEDAEDVKKIVVDRKKDANSVPYVVWGDAKKTVH